MENSGNLQEELSRELSSFRQQWQHELQQQQQPRARLAQETAGPAERCQTPPNAKATGDEDIENKAKVLFLTGVSLERKGKMPEAIRYYRQAIQLLPDIESRISDFNETELPQKQESCHELFNEELTEDDGDDDETNNQHIINVSNDLEGIVKKLDKMTIKGMCEPEFPTTRTHISTLPAELLMYIFKWVVSSRLDLKSLEQLARVCRGFYTLARDPEIWHLACARMWGVIDLGSPVAWNGCWREMFLERAHLLYNGVYISKISYVRPSERTFEQQYTPYQLIVYYRYLRFFMDGTVLFHTSTDDPNLAISQLSHKTETLPNVWHGNFRLVGNKVFVVTQKPENDGSVRRRGRRPVQQNTERFFHVELQLKNIKKRRNSRLTWIKYTCHTFYRATDQTTVSQFDLNHQFKPFYFSRVKSFEAPTAAPLGLERL